MDETAASALFAWLNRELWLITSHHEGQSGGLIATQVTPVSIVPDLPRVLVCVAHHHYTWSIIEQSQSFAVHLLGQENVSWVRHFGLQSGHEINKFASVPYSTAKTGSPIVEGAIGWLDCRIESKLDIGDRSVIIGDVVDSNITCYGPPLTLQQLQQYYSAEIQSEMRQKYHQDAVIDAEAIRAWREEQNRDQ